MESGRRTKTPTEIRKRAKAHVSEVDYVAHIRGLFSQDKAIH